MPKPDTLFPSGSLPSPMRHTVAGHPPRRTIRSGGKCDRFGEQSVNPFFPAAFWEPFLQGIFPYLCIMKRLFTIACILGLFGTASAQNELMLLTPDAKAIGMGGVTRAEDVLELMLAGATAVEVGAANLVNPYACRDIVRDLPQAMQNYNIQNLKDIIGGAHHG